MIGDRCASERFFPPRFFRARRFSISALTSSSRAAFLASSTWAKVSPCIAACLSHPDFRLERAVWGFDSCLGRRHCVGCLLHISQTGSGLRIDAQDRHAHHPGVPARKARGAVTLLHMHSATAVHSSVVVVMMMAVVDAAL